MSDFDNEVTDGAARLAAGVAGLRELAAWLEANPDTPQTRFGLSVFAYVGSAVERLEAFAERHGLTVVDDEHGSGVSCRLMFGPAVTYKLYGFDTGGIRAARDERRKVEEYAAKHGLVLAPAPGVAQ